MLRVFNLFSIIPWKIILKVLISMATSIELPLSQFYVMKLLFQRKTRWASCWWCKSSACCAYTIIKGRSCNLQLAIVIIAACSGANFTHTLLILGIRLSPDINSSSALYCLEMKRLFRHEFLTRTSASKLSYSHLHARRVNINFISHFEYLDVSFVSSFPCDVNFAMH